MKKNKNIFITSTGTNLGKTYCSVEIIKKLIENNIDVNVFKPILSGFNKGRITESDSYKILQAKGINPNLEKIKLITPWIFKQPSAPTVAAKKEKKKLIYSQVLKWAKIKIENADEGVINIFEGAGGLMVPIEATKTILDLIEDIDSKVILDAGNYLWSISHTISAIRNIQQRNIDIINVIINNREISDIDINDTLDLLKTSLENKIPFRKVNMNDNYSSKSFNIIMEDIKNTFL